MHDKNDEELAQLVQQEKMEAFDLLVERYEKRLLGYGRRFLFNYENIEDAVQDVFIKAYINIQSFNPKKKFSSWIYRIAHNHFINIIKEQKKEPFLFFDPDIIFSFSGKGNLLEKIEKKEERKKIENSLKKLNPKYREPVVLYYYEDKNYEEISDILKIPISTVGVRLRRARIIIKSLYEEE